MNALQAALKQQFPKEIAKIQEAEKKERRRRFEEAAARGKKLLAEGSKAVQEGNLNLALKELSKDRYACAASLAKESKRPIRAGYEDLEAMEKLLRLKVSELKEKSQPDTTLALVG